MDDLLLAKRAQSGDAVAFETLVRRHTETVWRFARTIVRDDHAAEEVVQDTFLKAHRGLRSFRGDSAITTWLYTICRRTALDRQRRLQAELVPLDAAATVPSYGPSSDDRLALGSAIDALPEDEREAFLLAAVLGYSQEESAALIGIPASTFRSRVARARARLAVALTSDDEEIH